MLDAKTKADEQLGAVGLELFKKKIIDERMDEIEKSLVYLKSGAPPRNELEQHIVEVMKSIPGGVKKYERVVEEDLLRCQTGIKEKFEEALKRSGRYLPIMEALFVNEYGLPIELTRLPFIESSFDYSAYSSVGAAGIWQFMKKTGRTYMTVNNLIDERRDPVESTRAAARYLQSAYSRLGSWPLAVTSYNNGVGGVNSKVREMGTSDITTLLESPTKRVFGFASGNFYPELLAAIEVHDQYHKYFPELQIEPPLRIAQVRLGSPLSVRFVTSELGVTAQELQSVNYGVSDAIWSGRSRIPSGYVLKVPAQYSAKLARLSKGETVMTAGPAAGAPIEGATSYTVVRGDTVKSLVKKFGVSAARIRELNGLSSDALKVGQTLQIKKELPPSKAPSLKSMVLGKKGKKKSAEKTYSVKEGDTLWSISESFKIDVHHLKKRNHLKGDKIQQGSKLIIPNDE